MTDLPPIVAIVGTSRSGTTFLCRSLDTHPDLLCADEPRIIFDYTTKLAKREVSIENAVNEYPSRYQGAWDKLNRRGKSGSIFVVKCQNQILTVPQLVETFPNIYFVHIYRDGRDVTLSSMWHSAVKKYVSPAYNPRNLPYPNKWTGVQSEADYDAWADMPQVHRLAQLWASWEEYGDYYLRQVPSSQVFHLKYEDLVAEPMKWAIILCNFLGIDKHHHMFDKAHQGSVGKWRHNLHVPTFVDSFPIMNPSLRRLGYEVFEE